MKQDEVEANGISLHFVEEGERPAVVFCHGFPAIWSSWKAQMEAVASEASAGFMAIALVLLLWKPKPIRRTKWLVTLWRYSMRLRCDCVRRWTRLRCQRCMERCDNASRSLYCGVRHALRTIDSTYIADAVAAFTRTGFHGPLNYRAIDPFTRHWAAFAGAKIRQPSMFWQAHLTD